MNDVMLKKIVQQVYCLRGIKTFSFKFVQEGVKRIIEKTFSMICTL